MAEQCSPDPKDKMETPPFEPPTDQQMTAMDDILDRIKRATPTKPYIMSVFSDPQFQHTQRTRHNWLAHTPFDVEEDGNIQYQTLLWRDPLETLFCLESAESMEARYAATSNVTSANVSRANTPLSHSNVKKKISLAAYQSKKQTALTPQVLDTKEIGLQDSARATPDLKHEHQHDAAPSPASQGTKRLSFSVNPDDSIAPSPKKPRRDGSVKEERESADSTNSTELLSKSAAEKDSRTNKKPATPAKSSRNAREEQQSAESLSVPMFLSSQYSTATLTGSSMQGKPPGWLAPKHEISPNSLINVGSKGSLDPTNGVLPPTKNTGRRHGASSVHSPKREYPPKSEKSVSNVQNSRASTKAKSDDVNSSEEKNGMVSVKIENKATGKQENPTAASESTKTHKSTNSPEDAKHSATPSHDISPDKRLPQSQTLKEKDKASGSTPSKTKVRHVKSNSTSSFFDTLKPHAYSSSPRILPSSAEHSKRSKVIKLKYDKRKRKEIEGILQIKVSPNSQAATSYGDMQRNGSEEVKPKKTDLGSSSPHRRKSSNENSIDRSAKRSRPQDPHAYEPAAKKAKPATEASSNFSSKTPSLIDGQTTPVATPSRTQLRETKRTASSATSVSKGTNQDGPAKVSSASDKAVNTEKWKSEQSRLHNAGRSIKKKFLDMRENAEKEQEKEKKSQLKKHAAVLGMESVLCFMQEFCTSDQYHATRRESLSHWKSIVPYCNQVSITCKEYPHLYGMSILLRSAVSSKILALYGKMKSKELEDSGEKAEALEEVLRELAASRQLAIASNSHLSRKMLASEYPKTCEAANNIPVGIITKPILAIRMCSTFLDEWTVQQKVPWTKELDEGLCSHL